MRLAVALLAALIVTPVAAIAADAPSATTATGTLVPLVYTTISAGPLRGVRTLTGTAVEVVSVSRSAGPELPASLGALGADFEVLAEGGLLLLAGGAIVEPVSGLRVATAPGDPVGSFAREAGGGLAMIAGSRLGFRRGDGFLPALELPRPGFTVAAASDGALYLHERGRAPGAIFVVRDLRYAKLAELPSPVRALTTSGARFFVAVDGAIYTAAPGDAPSILFAMRGFAADSLAADPASGIVYAAADGRVFAIFNGIAVPVLHGFAGSLRLARDAEGRPVLHVLNVQRRLLARVTGLEWLGDRRR
jgi:hypothetical protein